MKTNAIVTFSLLLTGFFGKVSAQGCSDAGFCTIGNLAAHKPDSVPKRGSAFSLSLPVGIGDDEVFVFTPGLEYTYTFSGKWLVQSKVTGNFATGNLGTAVGPGDLYLSATHTFHPAAEWKVSATVGTKLPLNQSTLKEKELSLPMQYQSSLGTIDLITGLSLSNMRWQFAAGWQQPLSGINRNNFLPIYWNKPSALAYPSTNDFNRRGDVLLRAAYSFSKSNRWIVTSGLLSIYHLGKDTYIDANVSARPIAINGSDGLTLNATALARYEISSKLSMGLSGGVPLVVRDVRPDGLTRRFVIVPEIIFKF